MTRLLGICLTALTLVLFSCGSTEGVTYTVASQKADCMGVAPQKCLLVMKEGETDWSYFYSHIEGFDYEPGYEYVLKVKEEKLATENLPADASSVKYTLVKVVSKTEKVSENMPEPKVAEQKLTVTAKILEIKKEDVGRGAAAGKFPVTVMKLEVTTSSIDGVEVGAVIYAEIINETTANPKVGMEYVFIAKHLHPSHALGTYLLETDVQDLI